MADLERTWNHAVSASHGRKTMTAIAYEIWDPSKGLTVTNLMSPPYQLAGGVVHKMRAMFRSSQNIHSI